MTLPSRISRCLFSVGDLRMCSKRHHGADARLTERHAALCRICEPIAFMSIFPYIYYMVQSFNITSDDRQIAIYAGMVTSAFAFAEFSSGFAWGRASDKVGRKPILLSGLAGTGLSMVVFGFAQNIQTALAARALGGLLNGYATVPEEGDASLWRIDRATETLAFSRPPWPKWSRTRSISVSMTMLLFRMLVQRMRLTNDVQPGHTP